MGDASATVDQLVSETSWLRRLAFSLVKDAAAADDLVQDTYEVATRQLPTDGRPLRPWLARVLVNLARMRGRSGRRRHAREAAVGNLAATPVGPDELVARVETQRMLAGLVLELAAPQRDVLLLHYFEGLASPEIGKRLGIAEGTVRWRLKHALDELRARLDAKSPDRAWVASIAALAPKNEAEIAGGIAVGKIALAALAALVAVGLVALRIALRPSSPPDVAAEAYAAATAVRTVGAVPSVASAPDLARIPGSVRVGDLRIEGRVIDAAGKPVELATVRLALDCKYNTQSPPKLSTPADGSFAFVVDPGCRYWLSATNGDTTARLRIDLDPLDPLVLQLGREPARKLRILEAGTETPIAGATVTLESDPFEREDAVVSGADGVAALRLVGHANLLRVEAADRASVDIDLTDGRGATWLRASALPDAAPLVVHLVRGVPITGRVVDASGSAVAGAEIGIVHAREEDEPFWTRARSEADGTFRALVRAGNVSLHATHRTVDERSESEPETVAGGAANLTLVLRVRQRTGEHVVTVLDEHDRPAAGAWVSAIDRNFRPGFSDETGRFTIRNTPHVVYPTNSGARIVARRGESSSEVKTVEFESERSAITLRIRPSGIAGIVVDASGAPVGGARVYLNHVCADREKWRKNTDECNTFGAIQMTVDPLGRFEFDVPSGNYTLATRHAHDEDYGDPMPVKSGTRDLRLVVR